MRWRSELLSFYFYVVSGYFSSKSRVFLPCWFVFRFNKSFESSFRYFTFAVKMHRLNYLYKHGNSYSFRSTMEVFSFKILLHTFFVEQTWTRCHITSVIIIIIKLLLMLLNKKNILNWISRDCEKSKKQNFQI